jgi:hypothetical protein
VPSAYTPSFADPKLPDREVIEAMTHENARNAQDDVQAAPQAAPQAALYALLAGAEGYGPAARNARLVHDDELADFLCGAHEEIVGEAKRLLAQRVAE